MPKEIYIDENGNERILSSSPSALSGLLDTDITSPSANQVLAYDSNGKVVNKTLINITTVSGTTTNSGALALPNTIDPKKIINCITNGTHDYAFPRGDQYLQVYMNNGGNWEIKGNASVSFTVLYYE